MCVTGGGIHDGTLAIVSICKMWLYETPQKLPGFYATPAKPNPWLHSQSLQYPQTPYQPQPQPYYNPWNSFVQPPAPMRPTGR